MPTAYIHLKNPAQTEDVSAQKSIQPDHSTVVRTPTLPTSTQGMVKNLQTAPPHLRRQMITTLQRQNGNRFVQRLVENYQTPILQRGATGCADCAQHEEEDEPIRRIPDIQRYTVPGNLSCMGTVEYINAHSPYLPNWAKTAPHYTFVGTTEDSHEQLEDGSYVYRMAGRPTNTITHTAPQDLPQWNPTERPNREAELAAWNQMHATLQTHENRHVEIAQTNETAMQDDWQHVNIEGMGSTLGQAQADAESQFRADKALWLAQSQAQQDMIDPFSVTLTCPAPPVEDEESASAESSAEPVSITSQAHGDHAAAT